MDVAEFEDLIDRLGEDLSRWPDAQRLAATALLSTSADAQAIHADAQALRRALAAAPVRAPAGLADRIVAAARATRQVPDQAAGGEETATEESTADAERR